jgi:hypothetical protein
MRPNTLETDRNLLYRLGRGTNYLQVGSVLATATNSVAASGYGSDYPQQLTQVSWAYTGSAPVANAITVELFRGTTSVIVATIPVATVAGTIGGVIEAPIDDWDFAAEALVCLVTGNAGNPAGSLVALTAVVRPL